MVPSREDGLLPRDWSRREFLKDSALAATFLLLPRSRSVGPHLDARPASEHDAAVAVAWFTMALRLVRTTPGYSPPVTARTFAYLGLTLYETVVTGMPGFQSLQGRMPGLRISGSGHRERRIHWPTAANAAMAAATRRLFSTSSVANLAAIDQLESTLRVESGPGSRLLSDESASWGKQVADTVLAWSSTDGGHDGNLRNFPSDYEAPTGPGLWAPTPPGFQSALQPHWGQNRTFAVPSGARCASGDHPPYSVAPDSQFYADALEVVDAVSGLTDEQREIARFWSDDPGTTATPPGHSVSILNQFVVTEDLSLGQAAECYLKVGLAVSDAFVTCWNTKYRYNLLRPVTYIRALFDDQWSPLLPTPPFPEFTSGHSVQSAAAFQVMADLFGDEQDFVDHTHDSLGLSPRAFSSFSACAEEAAISRLYGGIHFRPAIDLGLAQGRCVADAVARLPLKVGKRNG